jgi:ATP-dependent Clp protease ATP-binding subunit ClpX
MHYCGFCGKNRDEVERLIEGPTTAICNECIELMHSMLQHPPDPAGFKSVDEFRLKMGRPKKP